MDLFTAAIEQLLGLSSPDVEADIEAFVSSSALFKLEYSEDNETLTVFFNSGGVYNYYGVPKSKATYFINKAKSKGRYINNSIKGNYSYTRE